MDGIGSLRRYLRNAWILLALAGLNPLLCIKAEQYEVLIGIDHAPPYHWIDQSGEAHGSMIAMMRHVVSNSGGTAKFVSCPWARCLKQTENGQLDMLFGVSKTPERELVLNFIEPALIDAKVQFLFYQLPSARPITSFFQLYRLRVGVLRGGTYFRKFETDIKLNKVEFVDLDSAIMSLQKGRIDTFVLPDNVILPPQTHGMEFKVAQYKHTEHSKGYVVVSKKFAQTVDLVRLSQELKRFKEMRVFVNLLEPSQN